MRPYASLNLHGVTVVELLVVLAVIGVLAMLVLPGYRDVSDRSRRNEARAALLEIAQHQERYYLQQGRYGSLAELGYDDPHVTSSGAYAITMTAADAADFTAVATYQPGGKEAGRCAEFRLNARGDRASTPQPDCWTRTR